jgi:hypothetical protein
MILTQVLLPSQLLLPNGRFKFSVTKFNNNNKPTVWSVMPITQTSTQPIFHETKKDALNGEQIFRQNKQGLP